MWMNTHQKNEWKILHPISIFKTEKNVNCSQLREMRNSHTDVSLHISIYFTCFTQLVAFHDRYCKTFLRFCKGELQLNTENQILEQDKNKNVLVC